MKTYVLLVLFLLTGLVSSTEAKSNPADSVQIKSTILNFYKWYSQNYRKYEGFKLYSGIKNKDQPPYRINWKEVDRYLAYVKSTAPQLGSAFMSQMRAHFKEADSAFKVDVESDIPYGFDYDWFTNSQEAPQYLLDELKKSKQWVINVQGNEATVDVLGFYLEGNKKVETVVMCFGMKKEKNKWTISKIGCSYSDSFKNP